MVEVRAIDNGVVMVKLLILKQPLASITVPLYGPEHKDPTVVPNVTGKVLYEKPYGKVPPEAVSVAEPRQDPLHALLVIETVDVNKGGSVIATVPVMKQPLKSLTVTEYTPAHKLMTLFKIDPGNKPTGVQE